MSPTATPSSSEVNINVEVPETPLNSIQAASQNGLGGNNGNAGQSASNAANANTQGNLNSLETSTSAAAKTGKHLTSPSTDYAIIIFALILIFAAVLLFAYLFRQKLRDFIEKLTKPKGQNPPQAQTPPLRPATPPSTLEQTINGS